MRSTRLKRRSPSRVQAAACGHYTVVMSKKAFPRKIGQTVDGEWRFSFSHVMPLDSTDRLKACRARFPQKDRK